jgi:hypothetical protein
MISIQGQCFHCFGLETFIMTTDHVAEGICHFMAARKQKNREEGPVTRYTPQRQPSPNNRLPPIRLHLPLFPAPPNSPFSYESINGLIHWLGHSLGDQITSKKPHLRTLHWGPSLQHMNLLGGHFISKTEQIPTCELLGDTSKQSSDKVNLMEDREGQ